MSCHLAAQDIAAVRTLNQAYPSALVADDAPAAMELFTEDAVLLPHHGAPTIEGKAAIHQHLWPDNGPAVTVSAFTMVPVEIDGCAPFAYSRGTFSITFTVESDGTRKTFSNNGNYLMIYRKEGDASWHIARYIWNDPVPAAR